MQRKSQLALLIASIASIFMLSVVPVAAETSGTPGDDGSSDASTATSAEGTESSDDTTKPDSIKTEIQSFREKAKELVQTERKDHQETKTVARQKACEARQAGINRRVNNYATAAAKHLGVFDSILAKVENFYTSNNLNVSNYDTLLATAKSKQVAAQQAVDVLKGLDVSIDCTQTDPAQSVAAVKTAVAAARTALQAYRSSIKDVIVAIKGASTAQSTTTGGNQ